MGELLDSKRGSIHLGRALGAALGVLALALTLSACGDFDSSDATTRVNGSINVPAGRVPDAVATVNGSIRLADNAEVSSATTVNGQVQLGSHCKAASLNTVNGGISLGDDAHVSGDVTSVNGEFSLASGAEVLGTLTNVNGKIDLTGAHVGAGIRTVNGSMNILGASQVEGGLLVRKASGSMFRQDKPRIVIGPGSSVQGELRFERPVDLFVSDRASIGTVSGATAVPFSGDSPPN
jgi:hypothetical protein